MIIDREVEAVELRNRYGLLFEEPRLMSELWNFGTIRTLDTLHDFVLYLGILE
jgi:hypothetical protein